MQERTEAAEGHLAEQRALIAKCDAAEARADASQKAAAEAARSHDEVVNSLKGGCLVPWCLTRLHRLLLSVKLSSLLLTGQISNVTDGSEL